MTRSHFAARTTLGMSLASLCMCLCSKWVVITHNVQWRGWKKKGQSLSNIVTPLSLTQVLCPPSVTCSLREERMRWPRSLWQQTFGPGWTSAGLSVQSSVQGSSEGSTILRTEVCRQRKGKVEKFFLMFERKRSSKKGFKSATRRLDGAL